MDDKLLEISDSDQLLLVNLRKSFDPHKAEGIYRRDSIYDAARKFWKLNGRNLKHIQYVLGVFDNTVQIVIKPTKWIICETDDNGKYFNDKRSTRYACEGEIVEDSPFLGRKTYNYPFKPRQEKLYIPEISTHKEKWS